MNLGHVIPMLGVVDVAASRGFYEKAFGFRCTGALDEGGSLAWCRMTPGDVAPDMEPPPGEIMLVRFGAGPDARAARKGMTLYFHPDDVAGLHASLRSRGFAPGDVRVTTYRMKEFILEDPDGYQLWFGQATNEAPTVRE